MKRINITQAATAIGVAGVLGVAAYALAADQKPVANKVSAAASTTAPVKFEHVTVVAATPAQLAAIAHERRTGQLGMKVAIDPVSKVLRQYTQDDANAEAAVAAPVQEAAPAEITTASGLSGMTLTEANMSYAVANVGKDGKVRQACLENQKNADTALQTAATVTGENHNEK